MLIRALNPFSYSFPNPIFADDSGLLAYGGDLSSERLLSAYRHGIFPWYNEEDPILWWSPNPRMVLLLDEFKISKSLKKSIKKEIFEIKFDTHFREVITNCASSKRSYCDHTWLTSEMIDAYCVLFEQGYAHSFEAFKNGKLVGGGYGVVIGDIFCGESMFTFETDASKVALSALVERLQNNGFLAIDCQVPSGHLQSLGGRNIPREDFLATLHRSLQNPKKF